jgi:hypothetical protein
MCFTGDQFTVIFEIIFFGASYAEIISYDVSEVTHVTLPCQHGCMQHAACDKALL